MAKIAPKGKKVTGTKKKDKIVWQSKSAWKKALTVNAGAGNDTINFSKSAYKNTLNGQKGNDSIIGGKKNDIITGGTGNDIIKTGKGTNTVVINKGDGNDTVYHQGKKTTVKLTTYNKKDKVAFTKNGKDLIMTYTHLKTSKDKKAVAEKVTFKNYFDKNGIVVKAQDALYIKNALANTKAQKISALLKSKGVTLSSAKKAALTGTIFNDTITGSKYNDTILAGKGNDSVNGGAGNDTIKAVSGKNTLIGGAGDDYIEGGSGSDKLYGNDGNDTIYGSKGNDAINAGKGTNYIYHNSGDGNDTIYSGSGTDYLHFTSESSVAGQIAGNDVVLTRSNGENITLKDFMKGGHSVQRINIGGTWKDVANLFPLNSIYSSQDNETIHGTVLEDVIVVSHDNCEIYGRDGNDIISLEKDNFYVEGGKGNDEISIGGATVHGTLAVNNNDGCDTIVGIEKIDKNSGLTLKSDVMLNQYRNFNYINALKLNDEDNSLRINLANEQYITIKNYFDLPEAERYKYLKYYNPIKNKEMYITDSMILRENPYDEIVTRIPGGTLEYTIDTNNSVVEWSNNYENSDRTITLNADNCAVFLNNINNSTTEIVTITGNNNSVYSTSNHNNIITSDKSNEITITPTSYYSFNSITSKGNDTITISQGSSYRLDLEGNDKSKVINIMSDNATVNIDNPDKNISDVKHTDLNYLYKDNINLVFEYYWGNSTSDYEKVLFSEMNSAGTLGNKTAVLGKWVTDEYDNTTFNMDTDGMDLYSIKAGSKAEAKAISNFTQYVDMTAEVRTNYNSGGYRNVEAFGKELDLHNPYNPNYEYDYSFQLDNSIGLFQHRKNVYIKGSDNKDLWFDYELNSGKYKIDDRGGSDTFVFNYNVADIRTFFDIKANGTIGKDLYFMSSDDLSKVIYNWDALDNPSSKTIINLEDEANNFLCIKDAFNGNGGKIENVYAEDTYKLDYNKLTQKSVNSLIQDVVSWLNNKGCDSVSQAITDKKSDYGLFTLYDGLNIHNTNQQIWQQV